MDYKDKEQQKSSGGFHAFSYACQGIKHAFLNEKNMRIHCTITGIVLLLGWFVQLTRFEWLFVLFAIGGVIALELMNTAIERLVDLVTAEFHPLAKQAKDISAGAVFIYSILSVIVGLIIFIPKIF